MSPYSPSSAVNVGGGGGVVPVGLLSAGSRTTDARWPAYFFWSGQPATGCTTDPGGPTGPAAGTISNTS